jgi:hypothetical protein
MWWEALATRLILAKTAPIRTPAIGVKAPTLVMPVEASMAVHGVALAVTSRQNQKKTAPVRRTLPVRSAPWPVAFAIGASTTTPAML